jgi:hypothetical protein
MHPKTNFPESVDHFSCLCGGWLFLLWTGRSPFSINPFSCVPPDVLATPDTIRIPSDIPFNFENFLPRNVLSHHPEPGIRISPNIMIPVDFTDFNGDVTGVVYYKSFEYGHKP